MAYTADLDYYQTVSDPFSQKLLANATAAAAGRPAVHRRQRVHGPSPGA